MKSAIILAAAVGALAAPPLQQVMQQPQQELSELVANPKPNEDHDVPFDLIADLREHTVDTLRNLLDDTMDALDTVRDAVEDFADTAASAARAAGTTGRPPKPHTRRPDSTWDHIVRGADVQHAWVDGPRGWEREIDGHLAAYDLRAKAVDPSELGIDPGVKQFSGYLDDNEEDKHLFYWFFESRNDPENDPVVLWLNGGPGCSSLTGLFMELGPSSIDSNIKPKYNPYSWNSNASVIFLDQPVNVGYSYSGSSVSDTVAASKDVYALLTLFFKQFPQYAHQPFHIAGESYAGHYIPVFAAEILAHKKRNINLQSVLIGNGLTDPLTQYPEYRPMACGEGGYPAVVDESTCQSMDNALPRCLSMIDACYRSESVWTCVPSAIYCNQAILGPYMRTGQNPYDVREPCKGSMCYPQMDDVSTYLNLAAVRDALGVEVDSYESCNMNINQNFLFHGDWMKPFHRLVPSLLEKIPVLIYAGDADFICNWLGNLAWAEALDWSGQTEFAATSLDGLVDGKGKEIGQIKSTGNFTYMRLYGGGHMVPLDQPEASLEFYNRWIGGEWS